MSMMMKMMMMLLRTGADHAHQLRRQVAHSNTGMFCTFCERPDQLTVLSVRAALAHCQHLYQARCWLGCGAGRLDVLIWPHCLRG